MNKQETYYTFRLDDITPTMNWDKFLRLKAVFDKHGMKPVIGIVPQSTDPKLLIDPPRADYWEYLKQLEKEGWTLSQHGCNHQYVTKSKGCFHLVPKSEFAGLSYEEQEKKIVTGKKILNEHGIETDIFFAPSNTFDKNTMKILKKNGFHIIPSSYTTMPYESHGILFIPGRYAEPVEAKGLVTIYLHTNTMKEELYDRIDDFLEKHSQNVVSYHDMIILANQKKQKIAPKIELVYYILLERTKLMAKKILRKMHLYP